MNKKLAVLSVACTILIVLGGVNSNLLYSTSYLQTKAGYEFAISSAVDWWDCNWSYYKKIIIDHTKVQADQTNFPVLIYRSADAELTAYAQSDGGDIIFIDSANVSQYAHEIEAYNSSTGELTAWVKVASLSSTVDTILYMYYGNPTCSNQQNITVTWDGNHRMVQHLNESSGTLYDSTSYGNNGTNNGALYNDSAKIDGGYDFDGNDQINCGADSSLNITGQITLEGWVKDPPIFLPSQKQTEVKIFNKRAINITKAEHLDEKRDFLKNIYESVKVKDNNWSEPINNGEYVRVTFEEPLDESNYITIFARSSGIAQIKIYSRNNDTLIATFGYIIDENWYRVYLTNLKNKCSNFDLQTVGDPVEYDFIVDPETKDAVDSNTSDVDSSTDKGNESNFTNAQDTSPDTDVMTIQEVLEKLVDDTKDAVDWNGSNVDSSADKGNETNFANCMETAPDSDVMTLEEADQGSLQQVTYVVSGSGTSGTGALSVAYPANPSAGSLDYFVLQVAIEDTADAPNTPAGWAVISGPNTMSGNVIRTWAFGKHATGSETGTLSLTFTGGSAHYARMHMFRYVNTTTPYYGADWETWPADDYIYDNSVTTTSNLGYAVNLIYQDDNRNNIASMTGESGGDWIQLVDEYESSTGGDATLDIQGATMATSGTINGGSDDTGTSDEYGGAIGFALTAGTPIDYELDMEYQFNTTKYSSDNEQICFYLTAEPTETLVVSYRDGGSWTSLGNIVSIGWTNFTATGLTTATYNIQITDQNQTDEATQHNWTIDCMFIHTWNDTNYLIDFEYNWSNADFDEEKEEICIYVTSHTGSENLNVSYWSGSWTNLGQITSTGWTNITATGLTDATYEIRLNGTSESSDTSQDSWNIDVIMLHTLPLLNTSVDAISPYIVTDSPYNITATNITQVDNVTLYYRWSDDNSSWSGIPSVTYVDSAEASATDNPSATINKPAGTVEDDLMFAILISATESDTDGSEMTSAPSGWTEEHNYTNVGPPPSGQHIYIYWKIANSSEDASYDWTWTDAGCSWVGQILTFRGVNTSDPIHVEGVVGQESSQVPTAPSITTTEDNCMVLLYVMCDAENIDLDGSGCPETWIDTTETSGDYGTGLATAYFTHASASATGARDWTIDASDENSAQMYAFKPAEVNGTNWTIWNDASNPDTESPWSWDFNFPNSTGYYEFYSIGKRAGYTDELPPDSADTICQFNRIPTITDEGPSNGSTNIEITPEMNITINDPDEDTMTLTWYSNSSGSWVAFGANDSVGNGTYHQINGNFSDYNTTYWWNITVSDGFNTNTSATFHFTTIANSIPTVITNTSTGIEETNATLQGYLSDNGSVDTTCGFRYGTSSGSYSENFSVGVVANAAEFSNNNGSLTQGQIYFYQAWANNSVGFANGTEMTFLIKPDPPPTGLTAQTNSSSVIYLTWTGGTGANTTYIERNASGETVWARGAGTEIYNGSDNNYEDTGLTDGVKYYYQAWSYANWTYNPTIHQFSDENASANSTTNNPPTQSGEAPTNGSSDISLEPYLYVNCSDSDGNTLNATWWSNSSGSWVQFGSNETSFASGTNISQNNSNFTAYGTTYWWSVNVSDGKGDWSNETYHFTTELIDTSVDTISPYQTSTTPLNITATGPSDLDNVTLWYRWSSDNSTWWNSLFSYRKKITITGQTGAGTNYQVLLKIGETSGASGEDFDLGDNSSSFPSGKNIGGDLRFIDDDDTTLLDFWVESVSGSTPNRLANVWVEVKDDLGSNVNIYCYYGNPQATNLSNGTNTFIFFDDFDGVSLDTDIWTQVNGNAPSFANSIMTVVADATDPGKMIADVNGAGPDEDVAIRSKLSATGGTNADERAGVTVKCGTGDGRGYNFLLHDFTNLDEGGMFLDDAVAWGSNHIVGWVKSTYYIYEIYHDGSDIKGRRDDGTWYTWTRSGRSGYLGLTFGSFDGTVTFDWAVARKVQATEPTFNSASEEAWMKWSDASNPDTSSPWNWSFDFPNGTGYYEFYSIGNKSGSPNETAPSNADAICHFIPPTLPIVTTNASTGVEEINATLRGYLSDNGGTDTTCGFRYGTSSGSYSENFSVGIIADDTEFSNNNGSLTQGQIYFYQAWANNSIGFANGSEMTFLTKPDPPTGLTAQKNSSSVIYLTWSTGTGANTTYIERNASGETVWARGAGTVVYNGSDNNYEDTGLTDGVKYYYQAWSYANWTYNPTLHQYSDDNASANNKTDGIPTIELVNPSPNGTTITSALPICQIWANDSDGDTLTVYWYENSTGPGWTLRNTNNSVSANSTVNYTFTQFSDYNTTYYWKVAVNDSKYNTTKWYNFTIGLIDTSVNMISPYIVTYLPYNITATGPSDLDNVTLWYRFSTDNSSWGTNVSWNDASNPDGVYPWSWNFDFNNGTGYYEFYSIGNKSGSPDETAPGSADAICHYNVSVNNAPTLTGEIPANQSTVIGLTPQLNVTVDDGDLDTLNATWWSNSSGAWVQFGENLSIDTSGGEVNLIQTNSNFSDYGTMYWWSVNLSDGNGGWTNETYYFTTESIDTSVDTISPYQTSTTPLNITATGPSDLDNVTLWYRWSSDNSTWWNSLFSYRKKITITGQTGAGTNYQVLLKIGETSGASGEDFDLGGHSSNFPSDKDVGGDLRFTNNNGITPLDFWVESVSGTTPNRIAYVWVEIKDILDSNVDIYCYYGNPSASNASNGDNTFIFFDDFLDASINSSKWTQEEVNAPGSITEYSDYIRCASGDTSSPYGFVSLGSSSIYTGFLNNTIRFRARVGLNGIGELAVRGVYASNTGYKCRFDQRSGEGNSLLKPPYVVGGWNFYVSADGLDPPVDTWYIYDFNLSGTSHYFYRNGTLVRSGTDTDYQTAGEISLQNHYGAYADYDWVAVKKFVTTEPSFNNANNEEFWIQWNDPSNPDSNSPWSWDFDFPNSTGYYEFYSIGNKSGSPNETAPSSADAICYFIEPTIPTVITNASTGVEEMNATLHGWLQDNGYINTTCGFRHGTSSGSYDTNITNGIVSNNTEFSNETTGLTPGQIYFYQAWANNTVGFANGSEMTFLTKPNPPTSLTAQTNSSSVIYLTWTGGTGANNTYIERNASGETVWARGAGTVVYNGSDNNYEDTGLTDGVKYYYQAWSYANWTYNPTLHQYSDDNASASNTTNNAPILTNESPTNGSTGISLNPTLGIQVNDSEGQMNISWYWGNDSSCPNFIGTNSSVNNGTYHMDNDNNFSSNGKTYYWKVVVNDGNEGWANETYHFTTIGKNKKVISKGQNTYSLEISPSGDTLYGYINSDKIVQTPIDTSWHHVVMTYDGSNLILYKDGALADTTPYVGTIDFDAENVTLGENLTGTLDEARISLGARDGNWINTTYQNTNDPESFATFSSQVGVLSTWGYRKQISINASMVDNDLVNFPVLINTTDTDLRDNALANGNDILFIPSSVSWTNGSGSQRYAHEVEKYDSSTGELVAWVNVSSVSSSTDTALYMYYGNTLCGENKENREGVWDGDYVIVQHLNESSGTLYDSTSYGNNGTNVDDNATYSSSAKIDGGYDFDGTGDYIDVADDSSLNFTSNMTVSCWVRANGAPSQWDAILVKDYDDGWDDGYGIWYESNSEVRFYVGNDYSTQYASKTGVTTTDWNYVVGTCDGTTIKLYVNGVKGTDDNGAPTAIAGSLEIGRGKNNSWILTGSMDEVRISNVVRNISWINASYNNVNDSANFTIFDSQEAWNYAPVLSNEQPSNGATGVSLWPSCNVTVSDANGGSVDVYFYEKNSTGSWILQQTNSSVVVAIPVTVRWGNYSNASAGSTTYWWSVNCTDGTDWTNETYNFTTAASPFIYLFNGLEYTKVSDFIPGATSKEKEYTSSVNVSETSVAAGIVRLKITEELDETTYLDRIYLLVDGTKIVELDSISDADLTLLKDSDDRYLIMNQGDKHFLTFTIPESHSTLHFVAEGHYVEHNRSYDQLPPECITWGWYVRH